MDIDTEAALAAALERAYGGQAQVHEDAGGPPDYISPSTIAQHQAPRPDMYTARPAYRMTDLARQDNGFEGIDHSVSLPARMGDLSLEASGLAPKRSFGQRVRDSSAPRASTPKMSTRTTPGPATRSRRSRSRASSTPARSRPRRSRTRPRRSPRSPSCLRGRSAPTRSTATGLTAACSVRPAPAAPPPVTTCGATDGRQREAPGRAPGHDVHRAGTEEGGQGTRADSVTTDCGVPIVQAAGPRSRSRWHHRLPRAACGAGRGRAQRHRADLSRVPGLSEVYLLDVIRAGRPQTASPGPPT
ncbi:MAG: hypothetical protein JWM19_6428 [Actinomycetia bacterium]|nr:hypothetical protein [Actinomycetes bacterium]